MAKADLAKSEKSAARPPAAPRLPKQLTELVLDQPGEGTTCSHCLLSGVELGGRELANLSISAARLERVNLAGSQLPRCSLLDCELDSCNLANLAPSNSSLIRARFGHSKMTGFGLRDSSCLDLEFVGCRLDFASFHGVKFKQVLFRDCQLQETEFFDCDFESAVFVDCDLSRASFASNRFRRSEFRGCRMVGLRGLADLRGAAMNWEDLVEIAGQLAAELGIQLIRQG